jgi:hypothetical protein
VRFRVGRKVVPADLRKLKAPHGSVEQDPGAKTLPMRTFSRRLNNCAAAPRVSKWSVMRNCGNTARTLQLGLTDYEWFASESFNTVVQRIATMDESHSPRMVFM